MSVVSVCDAIAAIDAQTTHDALASLAQQCEAVREDGLDAIVDAIETALAATASSPSSSTTMRAAASSVPQQRLLLWFFVDRLAKQHAAFLDALRPRMLALLTHYAPPVHSDEWRVFVQLLQSSLAVLFGSPLVALVLLQLTGGDGSDGGDGGGDGYAANATTTTMTGVSSLSSRVDDGASTAAASTSRALMLQSNALRSAGAFVTKAVAFARPAAYKHTLQVKTLDSQMAMNVASSYAPAKPVEVMVPELQPDADAPRGYMQPLPADHIARYEEERRKRLRTIIERNRAEQDKRQKQELLRRVRRRQGLDDDDDDKDGEEDKSAADDDKDEGEEATRRGATMATAVAIDTFADVQMPVELPRDEYGVKRANFPLGVRFVRNAIAACGGAVELDVLVQRLSTMSDREAVAQFGNVREFLLLHSPTFRLDVEDGRWIVRLTPTAIAAALCTRRRRQRPSRRDGTAAGEEAEEGAHRVDAHDDTAGATADDYDADADDDASNNNSSSEDEAASGDNGVARRVRAAMVAAPPSLRALLATLARSEAPTWRSVACPCCSRVVRGRNLARHLNCRQCITAQIALGLQGDHVGRGPVAALAHAAKYLLVHRDDYDDGDVDAFATRLRAAARVRRLRLASPRQFAPILKALRVVRDRWLRGKAVDEVAEAVVDAGDASIARLFRVLGRSVHRLPIAWIETGDVMDMCRRFSTAVLPPYDPPPRPADPRISLHNTYPGLLLAESDIDDEDEPSGDEDAFSDDEAPAFTFAPPVELAESLFTACFARDTRRLQHRMRTAPPMILQRVLRSDRTQTQQDMYRDMVAAAASPDNVVGSGGRAGGGSAVTHMV